MSRTNWFDDKPNTPPSRETSGEAGVVTNALGTAVVTPRRN